MNTPVAPEAGSGGRYILGQKQIARYLGCSPSTLKRWIRAGRLPVSKLGEGRTGKVAISVHTLDRWIRKQSKLRPVNLRIEAPVAASEPPDRPAQTVREKAKCGKLEATNETPVHHLSRGRRTKG